MQVAQGHFTDKEGEGDLTRLESGMSFGMNVVDNLNSVQVINKPCMSSRNMCLLPRATLHSDSEQEQIAFSLFTQDLDICL